jgi:hypothetical protein
MNRTVREESGAWSLLKKAAVRAKLTASSFAGTITPKFPADIVGAPVVLNTARMFPARSATATTIGTFTDKTEFCTTLVTSETVSGVAAGGSGGAEDWEPPPLHDKHSRTAAHTNTENPESAKRRCFLVFIIQVLRENGGLRIILCIHYAHARHEVKQMLAARHKL